MRYFILSIIIFSLTAYTCTKIGIDKKVYFKAKMIFSGKILDVKNTKENLIGPSFSTISKCTFQVEETFKGEILDSIIELELMHDGKAELNSNFIWVIVEEENSQYIQNCSSLQLDSTKYNFNSKAIKESLKFLKRQAKKEAKSY